jgi:hypothetical protein
MTITHHTQDQIHRNRPPVVALIFYSTFVCFIVTFSMLVLILEAPSRTRLLALLLEAKAATRASSTAPLDGFRIPSLASVCPAKACVYSTVVSAHLCCLASMLLALVGLA